MKIINLIIYSIFLLSYQSKRIIKEPKEPQLQDNEQNLEQNQDEELIQEENSNNSVKHPIERELYQTYQQPIYQQQYQQPIIQQPVSQIPMNVYQQPIQQPQQLNYVQNPQYQPQYQVPQVLSQAAQPQQQMDQPNNNEDIKIVDEHQEREPERELQTKTSTLHPDYEDIKENLLKYVGKKKHFYYMERSLSQTFCDENYCKPGEDIYEKNNIEYPPDMSHDVGSLRKACLKRCKKVSEDEARYQKLNILRMNEDSSKRRILKIFRLVYNTPHYCLLLQSDKAKYSNQICEQIQVLNDDCQEHYQHIERACQSKRKLFDYVSAYKKSNDKKIPKKTRQLYYVVQKSYFSTLENSCSACSHQTSFYNKFYCNERKLTNNCVFLEGAKKNKCIQLARNLVIDCKAKTRTSCYQLCKKEGDANIPKKFIGVTQKYQCKGYCTKHLSKNQPCGKGDSNCKDNFKTQCHSACERQLYQNSTIQNGRAMHYQSQMQFALNDFNKELALKAAYDEENQRRIRQMMVYYNRDTIFNSILLMERMLYRQQFRMIKNQNTKNNAFESEMQKQINNYYSKEANFKNDPTSKFNIFDLEEQ